MIKNQILIIVLLYLACNPLHSFPPNYLSFLRLSPSGLRLLPFLPRHELTLRLELHLRRELIVRIPHPLLNVLEELHVQPLGTTLPQLLVLWSGNNVLECSDQNVQITHHLPHIGVSPIRTFLQLLQCVFNSQFPCLFAWG